MTSNSLPLSLVVALLALPPLPALAQKSLSRVSPAVAAAEARFAAHDPAGGIAELAKGAAAGDFAAAHALGHAHEKGIGVSADPAQAFAWYQKALGGNDPEAHFHVGSMLLHGKGAPLDEARGIEHLERSAKAGFAAANDMLALTYLSPGRLRDEKKGLHWLRASADAGNLRAQQKYAEMMSIIDITSPDLSSEIEAITYYRLAADRGDGRSQYGLATRLAARYEFAEAIRYFELAGAQGIDVQEELADARESQEQMGTLPSVKGKFTACIVNPMFGNWVAVSEVFTPPHLNLSVLALKFENSPEVKKLNDGQMLVSTCTALAPTRAEAKKNLEQLLAQKLESGGREPAQEGPRENGRPGNQVGAREAAGGAGGLAPPIGVADPLPTAAAPRGSPRGRPPPRR